MKTRAYTCSILAVLFFGTSLLLEPSFETCLLAFLAFFLLAAGSIAFCLIPEENKPLEPENFDPSKRHFKSDTMPGLPKIKRIK